MAEKFAVDRRRHCIRILPADNTVHIGDRAARRVAGPTLEFLLLFPFGPLHRSCVLAQQNPDLPCSWTAWPRSADTWSPGWTPRWRRCLGRGELLPRDHDSEAQKRSVDQGDRGHEWRKGRIVLLPNRCGNRAVRHQDAADRNHHRSHDHQNEEQPHVHGADPTTWVTVACRRAPGGPSMGTSCNTRAWSPWTVKSPVWG